MFGGRVTAQLAERGAPVRAMAHSEEGARQVERSGVEAIVADLDDAESLERAVRGVETVFLVTPMDSRVRSREGNVLAAAQRGGVSRIVKLYGAVKHHHDRLGSQHDASVEAIKASGLHWALVSPTSVLETSLLSMIPWIENVGAIVASAGHGRVAHVAADDVARAAAVVLAEREENGRDYVVTGPDLLSMEEVAGLMSEATGKSIPYTDLSDEDLTNALVQGAGMSPEQAEIGVVCHFRAWRNGDAEALTDTYRELTGKAPTKVADWIAAHRDAFAQARDRARTG